MYGPIYLFLLDDRIEIHTPGRAPHTVDEAARRAGVHVVRNPHMYTRLPMPAWLPELAAASSA